MGAVKPLWALLPALAALAGCLCREGNPNNIGTWPHQWSLPRGLEEKVFGPVPMEEVRDFVRQRESEGWEVIGYELASLPEDLMVDSTELDRPAPARRGEWTFEIPKTMDDGLDPPKKGTIPPYLNPDVKGHRQKYLVIMRRWL